MVSARTTDETRTRALQALVTRGTLSPEQARAVEDALREAEGDGSSARWTEIVGFVGGGLVFAGAVALVAASWEDLDRLLRAGLLLVVAVLSGLGGIAAVSGRLLRREPVPDTRRRVGGTLFVLTAVTAAMALGVALEPDTLTAPALLGLVLAAAGYVAAPTAVGLLSCGAFSVWALWSAMEAVGLIENEMLPYGLATLALGLVWGALALWRRLPNQRTGLTVSAAFTLFGAQAPLFDGDRYALLAYALTTAVAVLYLAVYRWWRVWVLIVAGVVGITIAVPEAIWDWTDGAIGGALLLLVVGLVLLAASGLGILLHRGGPAADASRGPTGPTGGGLPAA
ncbi:DUF2157 domain-containing protein [Thermobifida halotolerans]|uniref:DUF2157 domain-containing protein n=1 Tax=Thermobifida halotolerans TaxID=483545 RepID=A0AA97M2J1_9ACTN|nr:DUF2157 domain-containing protein [Thermobifida halotolerans]UOE18040.1 DUF2157 domain-containing protein [Thermobifida halotolerans]